MKTTMPLLYLTLVTLCPAHLGATIGLVAMVNKFKLPSKHPAAMQASQWFTVKLVMLLYREKLFLTLHLVMSYTCRSGPAEIMGCLRVVLRVGNR
jgi:hypothetical protein